jgi:4-hydroxy 2-oxovalerate aldolase
MVSGANSLPQKQVMDWVSKRFYSFNSILRALSNQSKGIVDNQQLPLLNIAETEKSSRILIVGGGPSVADNATGISAFLRKYPDCIIIHSSSRNAMVFKGLTNHQYFCLVGNEGHRLEGVFRDAASISGKCILPPYPRKMGTYIPLPVIEKSFELHEIKFTDRLKDTHTSLALQTSLELGAQKVYVVGYDGYFGTTIGQKEQDFFLENEYLFSKAKEAGLECISLTKTKYNNISQGSIYAEI